MDIVETANEIYLVNKENGFWEDERNVGELLMLVTSELGEAIEAYRKGKFADLDNFEKNETAHKNANVPDKGAFKRAFEYSIKDRFEDEIADAIIRLLDLCAGLDIPIERHIGLKLEYNKTREKLHGKKY